MPPEHSFAPATQVLVLAQQDQPAAHGHAALLSGSWHALRQTVTAPIKFVMNLDVSMGDSYFFVKRSPGECLLAKIGSVTTVPGL
jgi:hypothetical protein